jgi:hypothetical protein
MLGFGEIQKMKVKDLHWSGNGAFRIKLDEKPELGKEAEVKLRYGKSVVVVKVKLLEWNERYSEVLAERIG